jgi:hypothetical protein
MNEIQSQKNLYSATCGSVLKAIGQPAVANGTILIVPAAVEVAVAAAGGAGVTNPVGQSSLASTLIPAVQEITTSTLNCYLVHSNVYSASPLCLDRVQ